MSRSFALAMMTLVYVVNFLDRQILSILLPQIKAEFHLSDSALGLLAGPAFAVVYAVLGVPLAVAADRYNRRNIIAASLAFFSVMTVFCGRAGSFLQLLGARFGTGVGEAGTSPAINSIIADLYPSQRRASALSLYSAGSNLGLLIAFFGGGWIAEHYGWRAAFLVSGAAGLLVMAIFLATMEEPSRPAGETARHPGLIQTARFLWSQRAFRFIAWGTGLASISGYSGLAFTPSFLVRSHHMTPAAIGFTLALFVGVIGTAGTALSGFVAERFGRGDARWMMYVASLATACGLPFMPVFYLAGNLSVALAALTVPVLFSASFLGPSLAAVQGLAPARMRAQAAALLLLVLNLVGLGLGPQIVGIASDLLRPQLGADSLRYALLIGVIPSAPAALCFWWAARTLREDMARALEH